MGEAERALVTGATSGIGAAVVRALAQSGRQVLAVGRRADRLAPLAAETGCESLAADVRDMEALGPAIARFAPDILVNNAGVGHGIDGLAGLSPELVRAAVETNVTAPILLAQAAIAGMRARGRGHVVNLGSIAGLHTLVSGLYGATKAAVHLFSQNMRVELMGSGLRVTEIAPGRVASEFYQAAEGDRARLDAMGASGIEELLPEDVAAAVLFAVDAPARVNVALIELLPTEQAVGGTRMMAGPRRR